jgi:Thioesterase domain
VGGSGVVSKMNLLLVHGLWRTPLSFLLLVRSLRGWGHQTELFGYAAVAQSYDAIVSRLIERLERLAGAGPYAVIGHSLGGVLLRSALSHLTGSQPHHLIMLGTPNRPPRLAQSLGVRWGYRRFMGECGTNLSSALFYASLPVPQIPYTIVAGTAGPRGRWSPFGDELNDGVVAVNETRMCDDDPLVVLPVTHTFMMNNARVHDVIRRALATACEGR